MPGIVNGLAQTAYVAYDEYTKDPKDSKRQENTDLIFSLMQIRNILQFSIDVQECPYHERQGWWDEMYQSPGTFIIRKRSNNVADELEIPVITSDILSENPGLESAGSKQPQENIVDRRENIMNNEEASIEEAIGNDCEEIMFSYNMGKVDPINMMAKSYSTLKQRSGNDKSSSKQPQENIVDNEKDIMNNGEASKEEPISNNYEVSEMGGSSNKKTLSSPKSEQKSELLNAVQTGDLKKVKSKVKVLFDQYKNTKNKDNIQSTLKGAISLAKEKKVEEITKYLKCVYKGKDLFRAILDCNNVKSIDSKVNALLKDYKEKRLDNEGIKFILEKAKALAEKITLRPDQKHEWGIKQGIIKLLQDASVSDKSKTPGVPSFTQETEINGGQFANLSSGSAEQGGTLEEESVINPSEVPAPIVTSEQINNTQANGGQPSNLSNVERRESIMNNREGSTEELINFEEGEMTKRRGKLLAAFVQQKIGKIISEGNDNLNLEEEFKNILVFDNLNSVLRYAKNQEGSFKGKVVAFLTLQKNKKNGTQINGKSSTNLSRGSATALHETFNAFSGISDESETEDVTNSKDMPVINEASSGDGFKREVSNEDSDNEFVKVSPSPEDNTHSPQPIRVQDNFGCTSSKAAHVRDIIVKTRNAQNLQSAVLSSQQLASRNVIEIFNKHGREDFTPLILKLTVQEFLNNGISEITLPSPTGPIIFDLHKISKVGTEQLQNMVKVSTDLYNNGTLNSRTINAIGTGAQDDYGLSWPFSEEDPIPTPTPASTPNLTPIPNPILTPTPAPTPNLTPTPNPILTPTPAPTPNLTPIPNPILTPTPAPTPNLTPIPNPVPPVANNKSEQVNDTQTNGKLPNNPGNGSITATQNTQKSKLSTVAICTFAVAGILAGAAAPAAYFAFSVSLLTTGIIAGVAACCLVAAAIIYYCAPESQVENSEVEKPFNNTREVPATAVPV